MSDFDTAFKNAARTVFPTAQQQLCIWYIMKNVLHNVRKKWNGPLEGTNEAIPSDSEATERQEEADD